MKKLKKIIIICIILICSIIFIYSLYNIIIYKENNDKTEKIQDEINKNITPIKKDDNDNKEELYNINFNALKEINSDTVGYLKVLNTNIDYVIVKSKDNSYYLNHDFNKEYNTLGWPFADYRNKFDDTDKNIIIYGHDVKTGAMFGTLKKVLEEKWQNIEENRKIIFITENEKSIYEVFSTYVIDPENYYISTNFSSNSDYLNFLNKIKNRSNYNYNIDVFDSDSILTLSSCTQNGKKRVALHAKRIFKEINN